MGRKVTYGAMEIEWSRPPEAEIPHFIKTQVKVLEEFGHVWHRGMLPKHFTESGATEYGYRNRTKKYQEKKERLFRAGKIASTAPLVYSGNTRRIAQGNYSSEADTRELKVKLKGIPDYFYKNPRLLREELTRLSVADVQSLQTFVEHKLNEYYNED